MAPMIRNGAGSAENGEFAWADRIQGNMDCSICRNRASRALLPGAKKKTPTFIRPKIEYPMPTNRPAGFIRSRAIPMYTFNPANSKKKIVAGHPVNMVANTIAGA